MISILLSSRIKNNPDSNLLGMINSIISTCTPEELTKLELIIKYDDDDEYINNHLITAPFDIKEVTYNRCTGRSHLHHFNEYLFTLKNHKSKFILQVADDFIFTRPGWVSQILSFTKEYLFIGSGQCDKEPGPWHTKSRPPIETINYFDMESWRCIFGNIAPCFSVRLIEVCQNFGWTSSIDAWAYLLTMMCYQNHKINIFEYIDAFYKRTEGLGVESNQSHDEIFKKGFDYSYNRMQQTGSKNCENMYWFDLVYQQATNVYLNILRRGPEALTEYRKNE